MRGKFEIALILLLIVHTCLFFISARGQSFMGNNGRYILLADDAMISMCYAQNLIHHSGLVWFPAVGGQRTMGITNPGWTLIMAGTMLLNLPRRIAALPILFLNCLFNLFLIALVFFSIRGRMSKPYALIAAGWLATMTPLLFWSVHGFETPLETLLITIAMLSLMPSQNGIRKVSVSASLIMLTAAFIIRPDAALLFIVYAIISIANTATNGELKRIIPALAVGAAVIVLSFIAHRMYYGDWMPNTYYLKATGGAKSVLNGVKYILRSLWDDGLIPVLIFALFGFCKWILQRQYRSVITILTMLTFWLLYVVWTGGDAFPHGRFLLPIIPTLIIVATDGIRLVFETIAPESMGVNKRLTVPESAYLMLFGVVIVISFFWSAVSIDEFITPDKMRVDRVAVAEYLAKMKLPIGTKIALFEAGTIPFLLPEFRYCDLLGKNDRHIARTKAHRGIVGHNKWDFNYSLGEQKPDIIITRDNYEGIDDVVARAILANADKLPEDRVFFPVALWVHPIFVKHYRGNRILVPTPYNTHWTFERI